MNDYQTTLIELATLKEVEAEVQTHLDPLRIIETEQVWSPARLKCIAEMMKAGKRFEQLPEHRHWSWDRKIHRYNPLIHRFVGVEYVGAIQGLMRVDLVSHMARLSDVRGRSIVTVDFLETAPWNAAAFTPTPRFKYCGLRLIEAAVRISRNEGFDGRVGLHALPQARRFYEKTCSMVSLGFDGEHEGLEYFELPSSAADSFFQGDAK